VPDMTKCVGAASAGSAMCSGIGELGESCGSGCLCTVHKRARLVQQGLCKLQKADLHSLLAPQSLRLACRPRLGRQ